MIIWSDEEQWFQAEDGNFKARVVARFLAIAGEKTDEVDKYGHTVIVTRGSYCRHMGIPVGTFRHWLDKYKMGATQAPMSEDDKQRLTERRRRDWGVVDDPMPEAERKAIRAETHEMFEDVKEALTQLKRVGTADIIRECADDVREGRWSEEDREDINAAIDELVLARMEMYAKHESEN